MDPVQELKETCEKIGKAFDEFKAENDKQIKTAVGKAVGDALAEAKLEKLGQAIDDLTGKKEDLEKRIALERKEREELERKVSKLGLRGGAGTDEIEQKALADFNLQLAAVAIDRKKSPEQIDVEGFRAYKRAFETLCRKGDRSLAPDEFKVLQVGVEADGGYLVPADTTGRVVTRVWELSPIRQAASVQVTSSDRLEGIADIGEAADGWVGETDTRAETNTPQLGKYEIPVFEQYAQPKATQKLLDDASVDIEAWLAGKVADRFARREAAAFITGNGTSQPRGFTTYPTAATADATRAWGTLEHVGTGVNGDFAASTPADILYDVEAAFKTAYLAGAQWFTRRQVIQKIRKFKDSTNQYLWQPGLQAGKPNQLIGYPIAMCEDMPALAAQSLSLALANMKEAYQIVDRIGIRTLRDPFTEKPYVKFYSIRRVGGAVVNFEALKFVRFA